MTFLLQVWLVKALNLSVQFHAKGAIDQASPNSFLTFSLSLFNWELAKMISCNGNYILLIWVHTQVVHDVDLQKSRMRFAGQSWTGWSKWYHIVGLLMSPLWLASPTWWLWLLLMKQSFFIDRGHIVAAVADCFCLVSRCGINHLI